MTSPLVCVQTRDRTGRTILSVYNDTADSERGYALAYAGPGHAVYVDPQTPPDVASKIKRLSENELVRDPWQDLSWLTTHRVVDGALVAVPGGSGMTEPELIGALTDKVAETIADADVRHGYWRDITSTPGQASPHLVRYYLRMAGAALTVLAPMVAERDKQIDQLRWHIGSLTRDGD